MHLEQGEKTRRIEPVFRLVAFIKMAFCLCCFAMGATTRACVCLCFDKLVLVEKREI